MTHPLQSTSSPSRFRGTDRAIVIVTEEIDPHADLLVLHLERRGIRPVRFHPQSIGMGENVDVRFCPGGKSSWSLTNAAGRIESADVGSIWNRRTFFAKNPALSPEEADFVEGECRETVFGLLRMTDAFWVSHPDAIRIAESKPYQLKIAGELGFRVPQTLITNRPEAFREFYEQCNGKIIYKPLTQGRLGATEGKGIYTNSVKPEHLHRLDSISAGPCLFQEHLPKAVDLRVTVIGDRLFPVEIHSQAHELSQTDWRRGSSEGLRHELHVLPAQIEATCLALVRQLKLQFGAIDLVLTPEGEYVFLEINPSGQFAWIESLTKLPLIETLADLLISKCSGRVQTEEQAVGIRRG